MEKLAKRIIAIVIIAGLGVGGGLAAWYFLLAPPGVKYETPGVTGVSSNRMIKIGVLGDTKRTTGEGAWQGAWLAAYEINTAGGIDVGGETYYIGLISEDTDEENPYLDVTKGVAAAQKIIEVDEAEFLLGGFRTEALKAYIEVVMDKHKIFMGTGAATDYFCENVRDYPNRYKTFFRAMPINSTELGNQLNKYIAYLAMVAMPYAAFTQLGWPAPLTKGCLNITQIGILREDLDWTLPIIKGLNESIYTKLGITVVHEVAAPPTAGVTDFEAYWAQMEAKGAQVVLPLFSAAGGSAIMMKQYGISKPKCLVAGIDVGAQVDTFWGDTLGGCEYEILFQPVMDTNKTPTTQAHYKNYIGNFTHEPVYTASGSYDAVYLIAYAIEDSQSFNYLDVATSLEGINKTNPFIGAMGHLAFNNNHDLEGGYPYGYTLFAQWQANATKVCLPTAWFAGGAHPLDLYPPTLATGDLLLPPWNITKT